MPNQKAARKRATNAMLVLFAALVLGITAGTAYGLTAHTTTTWPAGCQKSGCIDKHLNNLDARLRNLSRKLSRVQARLGCVAHVNLTTYNKLVWNYATNQEEWMYTLNNTHYGDGVDYQMLYDACTPAAF